MIQRQNSFDFGRFLAATGVLVSHHYAINGRVEPTLFGVTMGYASVAVFFFMSGYLIYQSLDRNPSPHRFVAARTLRILPNLVFSLLAVSSFLLLYFGNFENAADHLRYVAQNIIMLLQGSTRFTIDGVFKDRPYEAINGSLWTLPYEVWCYIALFLIFRATRSNMRTVWLFGALAFSLVAYFLHDFRLPFTGLSISRFGSLAPFFFAGSLLAAFGQRAPLLSSPRMHWFSRGGDASYGIYIFAWPVQQLCSMWFAAFWVSLLAAFVLTTLIGYLTWHLFEKRCMRHVEDLASLLRRIVPQREILVK